MSCAHQLPVRIAIVAAEINAKIARQIVGLDVLLRRQLAGIRRGKGRPAARPASAPTRRPRCAPGRSPPARTSAAALHWARCIAEERRRRTRGGTRDCRPVAKPVRGRTAPSGRAAPWERSTASPRRESRCACRRPDPDAARNWRYFSGVKLRLNSSRSAGIILRPR